MTPNPTTREDAPQMLVFAAELSRLVAETTSAPRAQRVLGNLSMVVQFNVSDAELASFLAVASQQLRSARGIHPKPTVFIDGEAGELVKVLQGGVDITHPLSQGKITVKGNYYHAIDLSRLALAVRQSKSHG